MTPAEIEAIRERLENDWRLPEPNVLGVVDAWQRGQDIRALLAENDALRAVIIRMKECWRSNDLDGVAVALFNTDIERQPEQEEPR